MIKNFNKCRCGNNSGKRISPRTNLHVCESCYKLDREERNPKFYKTTKFKKHKKCKVYSPTFNGFESTKAKEFCDNLKRKKTLAESKFVMLLNKAKVSYVFQHPITSSSSYYIVDFYLPKYGIVVEIDGGYHETEHQKNKDKNRDLYLESKGYSIIRLKNKEVLEIDQNNQLLKLIGLI